MYFCPYIEEIDGRRLGIAGTGSDSYEKSYDYDEVAENSVYKMVQPAGTLTSINSGQNSSLEITNPSWMETQHLELPARRNIYSTMSDRTLALASPYEEPVESSRVRICDC